MRQDMSQNILFLCPHGVAKSVMAAAITQQLALEAGLEMQISNAGTEPDEFIPAKVIDLLASDGLDVNDWQPRLVKQSDLERADRVISLGCDLQAFDLPASKLVSWADVPSPSENLIDCRDTIEARVKNLIAEILGVTLAVGRFVPIPNSTEFDHGAFDSITNCVFLAHTGLNTLEVIDHKTGTHLKTLEHFTEAAGVVVARDTVLVTNRGAAELAVVNAKTLEVNARILVGPRPNGVAIAPKRNLAVVACIGNETVASTLECIHLETLEHYTLALPGRSRWCVIDENETRVFLAVREPSMVLVANLPDLSSVQHWPLPSFGAHGIDIDHAGKRLFVACDAGALIALSSEDGTILGHWPLPGGPDATFFNPDSGLVHVAIGNPGVNITINPETNARSSINTEPGAGTTTLVRPDRLYVFLASRGGALEVIEP
jgi:YVTN family beta-propeller protein